MSQENVELRYRAADAFKDGLARLCDPDVVFISRHLGLEGGGGTHHGVAPKVIWWRAFRTEAEALEAAGLRES